MPVIFFNSLDEKNIQNYIENILFYLVNNKITDKISTDNLIHLEK